jgi:membrane protein
MNMSLKKMWAILKGTIQEFGEDKVVRLSAALAYYAIFSIGPLLVIAVGLASLAFGHDTVRKQIQDQLQSMLGEGSAKTIESMMTSQRHGTSLLTTIVGMVALLFGAAGVFGQLQDALNTIWEVKPKPGIGIKGFLRARFLSLTMVLGTGFLLLVSMALTTFLAAASGSLGNKLPIPEAVVHILNFVVSFAVISTLFGMIFKFLPDVKIPYSKVWPGAIGTALLFTIGKYLLAFYLGRESTTSAFGAAGSVIVVLMWVYYASLILFLGAEFTQVYCKATGAVIVPARYAMPVTREARAQQGMAAGNEGKAVRRSTAARRAGATDGPCCVSGPQPVLTPGDVIRNEPLRFLGLMAATGFASGVLLRFKSLRRAVRLYALLRK